MRSGRRRTSTRGKVLPLLVAAVMVSSCGESPAAPTLSRARGVAVDAAVTPTTYQITATEPQATASPLPRADASTTPDGATMTAAPTATPTPSDPPPVVSLGGFGWPAELSGRIVGTTRLWGEDTSVWQIDTDTRVADVLWTEPRWSRDWAVDRSGRRIAYRTTTSDRPPELEVRTLEQGSVGVVVGRATHPDARLEGVVWSADGSELLYGDLGLDDYGEVILDQCNYRSVSPDGSNDRLVWSGRHSAFPQSAGCPQPAAWDRDSGRIAVFEFSFEASLSNQMTVLDTATNSIASRAELQVGHYARAQSTDGVWVAMVDAAVYYPGYVDIEHSLYVHRDRWPGSATLRLLNLPTTGVLEVASWNTDIGFVYPVWSPDDEWIAFAEPMGAVPTPLPPPTIAAYPGTFAQAGEPEFRPTATRIRIVSREGADVASVILDRLNVWPAAFSPDGRYVLVAAADRQVGKTDLYALAVSGSEITKIAEVAGEPYVRWVEP